MNYFELYPGDYLRDTAELTLAEHGAFLLLLSTYYATERAIPSDNPTLFRLVRAMTVDEQNAVSRVSELFFPISTVDGLRHNKRADEEIVKARARIDAARENGRHGGRPKKPINNPVGSNQQTHREPDGVPNTKAPQTPHAIQEQRSTSLEQQAARKTAGLKVATRFAEFWDAYPVKKGKAEAEARWRAKGYDAIADRIIADVKRRLADDRQWLDARFIPHGSTYVNGQGWEDGIESIRGDGFSSDRRSDGETLDELMARAT